MFFAPLFASAQVVINEVMYDLLEGADNGREWVEVKNDSGGDVDLTGWKFNDGANHNLVAPPEKGGQGSLVLPSGAFAILAADAVQFLAEHQTAVTVIDTVMSLGQQNDKTYTLELIDPDQNSSVVSSVSYTTALGANGDGNSLQKSGSSWIAATPTPGIANAVTSSTPPPAENNTTSTNGQTSSANTSQNSSSSVVLPEESITAALEVPKSAITGVEVIFTGKAWGLKNEPLDSARFLWAFGDGSMTEGRSIVHTYTLPGDYIVVLEVSSGKYNASARTTITASPSRVRVGSIKPGSDGFIEIANDAGAEVDLSFWQLSVDSKLFVIPKNTRVLPGKSIMFPNYVTGLSPGENTLLYYPNGTIAAAYESPASVAQIQPPQPSAKKIEAPKDPGQNIVAAINVPAVVTASSSSAAVAASGGGVGKTSNLMWYLILGGVIFVAGAAYWVAGRERRNEVDGFTIIEDRSE